MLPRLIFLLLSIFTICIAQSANNTTRNLVCISYGICERCPDEALHQPFCQPFGNRRLVHCRNITSDVPDSGSNTDTSNDDHTTNPRPHYAQRPPSHHDDPPSPFSPDESTGEGTVLVWESCGRVVSTERADFFEFVAVNLLFVCVGVGMVLWRSRRMRVLHARQLAARIGMVGGRR